MLTQLQGKVGIEIELLAPRGASRATLARAIAAAHQGTVRRYFHPQSEPSKIPGTPILENLTLGFEVLNDQSQRVAQCVDDLTLQADCDRTSPPKAGWYRIVSDDRRLLRLVSQLADAQAPLAEVLDPVADLFDVGSKVAPNGMVKVETDESAPIAIAAPLPGERERPCELITPPWTREELPQLAAMLAIARDLDFAIPVEGATHFHFDAAPLCNAATFKNLVNLLWTYGPALQRLVGTNGRCQRLGPLPKSLMELVQQPGWDTLSWPEAVAQLRPLKLSKYGDFNFKNMVYAPADKYTFEARIFPVWLTAELCYAAIGLMDAVLRRAQNLKPVPFKEPRAGDGAQTELLAALPLSDALQQYWHRAITNVPAATSSPP